MTRFASLAATAIALSLLIAGCAAPPRPAVTAAPAPPPPPAPAPPPVDTDWRDLPLSAGGWSYTAGVSSSASFGAVAAPALVIHCDKAARRIRFTLPGPVGPATLTITTSYAARDLPLAAGAAGAPEASLPAADPFLDRIAFSRGRVSYAVPGRPLLMVPAWAEPARVIEDCRG